MQFALASIIEAIRRNPDKYNNLLAHDTISSTTQQSLPLHIEGYKDMILEETDKFYNILVKDFINRIMDNAVGASSNPTLLLPQSSSSTFPNQPNHTDIYGIESQDS